MVKYVSQVHNVSYWTVNELRRVLRGRAEKPTAEHEMLRKYYSFRRGRWKTDRISC